jgi:hypothetical protein
MSSKSIELIGTELPWHYQHTALIDRTLRAISYFQVRRRDKTELSGWLNNLLRVAARDLSTGNRYEAKPGGLGDGSLDELNVPISEQGVCTARVIATGIASDRADCTTDTL